MKIYVHVDRYGDVKILMENIDTNVVDPKQLVQTIKDAATQLRRDVQEDEKKQSSLRGWG